MSKKIDFVNPLNLKSSRKEVIFSLRKGGNIHGPGANYKKIIKILNKKYRFKRALLTNSCTSALEISALAINFKPNDEVIIPSYTFISTGSSFARTNANIIYCDIEENTLMPSFNQIKLKVTKKTKAIVIIHYQGFCVDYLKELKNFCKKKNIYLIEDAAQSFGTRYQNKYLGSYGDLACFSFHQTKNIHSGVGGCLVVNNSKLYNKCLFAYDKGSDRILQQKKIVKWYSWVSLGSSYLMSELHASYLYPQVLIYNRIIKKRKVIYDKYLKQLDFKNKFFYLVKNETCKEFNYHGLVIILKKKNYDNFLKYLKKFNIQAFIGYIPLHKSKYGKRFLNSASKLDVTDKIYNKIVRLPIHINLSLVDIQYISKKIKDYFNI